MVDEQKEFVFDTLIQWLKDEKFTVTDEKRIIVTSEFYAKVFPPNEMEKFFEITSEPNYKDHFLLKTMITIDEKDKINFKNLKEEKKKEFFDKVQEIASPLGLNCKIENTSIIIDRLFFVDPSSVASKQHIINFIEKLLSVTPIIQKAFYDSLQRFF